MERMIERALEQLKIVALNEMQLASMKAVKTGKDVLLLSPTGSGKTLAFLLPLLDLFDRERKGVQAMVVVPSRELALQIEQVFRQMGTGFKVSCCYGGHSTRIEKNSLEQAPALLVGTPGRIAYHITKKNFDASTVRSLVLDEFDKALEFGYKEDMSFILQQVKEVKQRILTSATKGLEIPAFAGVKNPIEVNFLKDVPVSPDLELKKVIAEGTDKLETLFRLICKIGDSSTLVFCNHREAVERFSALLWKEGIAHGVFHGGMEQEDRERALIKFRNGSHNLLVTTDLASRGLDIPEVRYIVHYQLPQKEDVFVHRNGRTARMNAQGTAYLVLAENETVPTFIKAVPELEELAPSKKLPGQPAWQTLYIAGGKKDRINKVDIVGLLLQKGKLLKEELGLIEVLDHSSYAAVKRNKMNKTLELIRNEKIKNRKIKIAVSE